MLAEIGKFTAEEKQHYYKSLENMDDYYNIINTATEEAEKRGITEKKVSEMFNVLSNE